MKALWYIHIEIHQFHLNLKLNFASTCQKSPTPLYRMWVLSPKLLLKSWNSKSTCWFSLDVWRAEQCLMTSFKRQNISPNQSTHCSWHNSITWIGFLWAQKSWAVPKESTIGTVEHGYHWWVETNTGWNDNGRLEIGEFREWPISLDMVDLKWMLSRLPLAESFTYGRTKLLPRNSVGSNEALLKRKTSIGNPPPPLFEVHATDSFTKVSRRFTHSLNAQIGPTNMLRTRCSRSTVI